MRFLFILLFLFAFPNTTFAFGALVCGYDNNLKTTLCVISWDDSTRQAARDEATTLCNQKAFNCLLKAEYERECLAASYSLNSADPLSIQRAPNLNLALQSAQQACGDLKCEQMIYHCDSPSPYIFPSELQLLFPSLEFPAIRTGISFGLGLILVLLIYARRASLLNFIVHGSLPYKLPVYGEDIQCLFKRTQRVNWYGRVVFGVVANLSMTHDQLTDVRKYWLGRIIAFDSLRRQRQNQLARMHLQLAAAAVPETKGKTALRQLWTALKYIFFVIFYLVRALFSFLFSFLFIRITIARLVRGTIVESRDLVLILQAKDAIDKSANYLKEYLAMANTFDGRDEVYEPE